MFALIIDSQFACRTAAGEAEAYAGVRKWTKGIDIFKKDFLVIPINEQ
jgi:Ulp1 family protease